MKNNYIYISFVFLLFVSCKTQIIKHDIAVKNIELDSIFFTLKCDTLLNDVFFDTYDSMNAQLITGNIVEQIVYFKNMTYYEYLSTFLTDSVEISQLQLLDKNFYKRNVQNTSYYLCGKLSIKPEVDSYVIMSQLEYENEQPLNKELWSFNVKDEKLRSVALLNDAATTKEGTYRKDGIFIYLEEVPPNYCMLFGRIMIKIRGKKILYNCYTISDEGFIEMQDCPQFSVECLD